MPDFMEGVVRAALAFIVLLVLARLIGRHNQSQLTFFDLVTGVAIGGMTALLAANTTISVWTVLASLLTFIILLVLNQYVVLESRPLRKLLRGEPVVKKQDTLENVTDMSDKEV